MPAANENVNSFFIWLALLALCAFIREPKTNYSVQKLLLLLFIVFFLLFQFFIANAQITHKNGAEASATRFQVI